MSSIRHVHGSAPPLGQCSTYLPEHQAEPFQILQCSAVQTTPDATGPFSRWKTTPRLVPFAPFQGREQRASERPCPLSGVSSFHCRTATYPACAHAIIAARKDWPARRHWQSGTASSQHSSADWSSDCMEIILVHRYDG